MENENLSAFEKGLKNDIGRNIIDAVHYYEISIAQNEIIKEAYINLLVIHWLIIYDYGFYERYGFNDNNYNYTENQYEKFLELGKKNFPMKWNFYFGKNILTTGMEIRNFSWRNASIWLIWIRIVFCLIYFYFQ